MEDNIMNTKLRIPGTNRYLNPKITKFVSTVIIAGTVTLGVVFACNAVNAICNTPVELFDTVARNQLREQLNNRDEEAITYYTEYFIDRNNYLFNGPLTIELMAEKYGYDFSDLHLRYVCSSYDTVQEFYNNEIVPELKERTK